MNDLRHTFLVDTTALSGTQTASASLPVWAVLLVVALVAVALSQLPVERSWRGRLQMSSIVLIACAFVATTIPYYFARHRDRESADCDAGGAGFRQADLSAELRYLSRRYWSWRWSRSAFAAGITRRLHATALCDAHRCRGVRLDQGGKPGTIMPAFGDALDDEQVWQVITYIRQFAQGAGAAQQP